MSDAGNTTPSALPSELPGDATPAQPSDPSPISDASLPAVVTQLRPIFAEIVAAAVAEAIAAVPTPTLRPGTVQTIDMVTRSATVTLDESTDETGAAVAQIIGEMPVINDRVMVLFVPPHAAFIIGIVGGSGVPASTCCAYFGSITSAVSSSSDIAPPRGWLWAYGQDYDGGRYPALWAALADSLGAGATPGSGKLPDMRGRMPIGLDNMGGTDAGRISVANVVGTSGGAESHGLSTSNLPSHNHSTPAHGHSVNGHTHSIGSHSHTYSTTAFGSSYGSTAGVGDHIHTVPGFLAAPVDAYGQFTPENGNAVNSAGNQTYGGGAHSHSYSGSASVSVSGTTDGASGGSTGSAGSSTDFSGGGTTGSAGSGSAVNHLPPYLVVHWIIKA